MPARPAQADVATKLGGTAEDTLATACALIKVTRLQFHASCTIFAAGGARRPTNHARARVRACVRACVCILHSSRVLLCVGCWISDEIVKLTVQETPGTGGRCQYGA